MRISNAPAPTFGEVRTHQLTRRRWRRLRSFVRLRRRFGWLVLAVPPLLILAADATRRGERLLSLSGKYVASYALALVESAVLWGLLLFAASLRRGVLRWAATVLFVAFATCALGCQLYFYRQYSTYLNLDATLFGTSLAGSLFGQLKADSKNFLVSIVPPLLLAASLVWIARRMLRPRATCATLALGVLLPAVVLSVFLIPCSYRTVQASTPDVIYFHAIGGLIKELTGVRTTALLRPGLRTPPKLPTLVGRPPRTRNVVLVLTESVRADVACSAHVEDCPVTPETNAAAPDRFPLTQMRSNSSTTAVELAVLWSGLEPSASREALHAAPLLFDYAHAAGIESAYWTSHHMMFANSRLFVQDLPTTFRCGATDLDPVADIDVGARDELVTERAMRELPQLTEPFFAVVHFGNTHVPYLIDPNEAPFQPAFPSKAPEDREAYFNYYKNAVHRQDRTIADLIRFVRANAFGDRTVLLFTSDHGESFHEHGQIGHTGSIFDEEIHVPAWVDAPPGTLTPDEEDALRANADALAFHTDLTPTVLDLLGLWDEPQLASYRSGLVGASLVRPREEAKPMLALTNCSGIWSCAFRNWGMMKGSLKLEGRQWDPTWRCYDVLSDPREERDLGSAACGDLGPLADALYGGLPSAP